VQIAKEAVDSRSLKTFEWLGSRNVAELVARAVMDIFNGRKGISSGSDGDADSK
jgi:hypothetical protein